MEFKAVLKITQSPCPHISLAIISRHGYEPTKFALVDNVCVFKPTIALYWLTHTPQSIDWESKTTLFFSGQVS